MNVWLRQYLYHEPASILPDSDDVSGLGCQSEIKFSINNVYAAFIALEGPTCTALIKMTGKYKHNIIQLNNTCNAHQKSIQKGP